MKDRNHLTFKKAIQIFNTSKEDNVTINFYKGKELLIGQLFRSNDILNGDWQGVEYLKKDTNVLMFHFNDNVSFIKLKNSKIFNKCRKVNSKGDKFLIYSFSVNNPFRVYKTIRILRRILYPIYEFNGNELLEFEVVAY